MEYKETINFLYIADLIPPSGIRVFEISKRLIKENIIPIILTRRNNKNKHLENSYISRIKFRLEIYRSLGFELKNKYLLHLSNHLFRFDFYLDWIPFAYLKAKKILKKNKNVKFIYASGPWFYTHIVGYLLKLKFNLPLILEYRDPWSHSPYREKSERWLNEKLDSLLEKKILKSSDMIITVSPALISLLKTTFPFIKSKPMISISNGLNIEIPVQHQRSNKNKIVFTFAGRLYGKRSVSPLLKILSSLNKESFFKDIMFTFKIFGFYEEKALQKEISNLNITDLVYLGGFISRDKVFEEISNCNLAIHIGENLNYPTISFKVWEYLSCRKKIIYLGLEDSYTANFLKKREFGITIPLNDLIKGKKILKEVLNNIINSRFENTIKENNILNFTWDKIAAKFIETVIYNEKISIKNS